MVIIDAAKCQTGTVFFSDRYLKSNSHMSPSDSLEELTAEVKGYIENKIPQWLKAQTDIWKVILF